MEQGKGTKGGHEGRAWWERVPIWAHAGYRALGSEPQAQMHDAWLMYGCGDRAMVYHGVAWCIVWPGVSYNLLRGHLSDKSRHEHTEVPWENVSFGGTGQNER